MTAKVLAGALAAGLLVAGHAGETRSQAVGSSQRITGRAEPITSPDGRLDLVWRRNEAKGVHEIWVRPTSDDAQARLLYSFGRDALVLWAPNGTTVAITDRLGSDETRVRVFRLAPDLEAAEILSVAEYVETFFLDGEGRPAFGHSYAYAMRWARDSNSLQVELRAYDPVDGSRRTLKKTVNVRIPKAGVAR